MIWVLIGGTAVLTEIWIACYVFHILPMARYDMPWWLMPYWISSIFIIFVTVFIFVDLEENWTKYISKYRRHRELRKPIIYYAVRALERLRMRLAVTCIIIILLAILL